MEGGLATIVGLAVAVCAVLPKLARLVTLAGLVSGLSSNGKVVGIVSALAAADMPSLIAFVATGASWSLLMPTPPPLRRDVMASWPGFLLIAPGGPFCASSIFRRSSSSAAAPVSDTAGNTGENVPPNRGAFAGETTSPAFAIDVRFVGGCV